MSLIFPFAEQRDGTRLGISTSYGLESFDTGRFRGRDDTLLYEHEPRSFRGGQLQSFSAGIVVDSRDREILTRRGQWIEFSYEMGMESGGDNYNRLTLIDRRYASSRRWTLAHRLSGDVIFGPAPFWKLRSVGGTDPILDINGSGILIGAAKGRYHERYKIIESLEPRYRLRALRFFGQLGEGSIIPLGLNLAQFGPHFAWSAFSGISMWWNRSLLLQVFFARAIERNSVNLLFGHEF